MLAEILKGTFKAYGSAYGHGVSGVNMGAKTGTGTYGQKYTKSIIYLIMLPKIFGLMVSVQNILCRYGWASIRLNNTEQIHLSVIQNKSIHNTCMKM